jgi:hypothetical protein
MFREATMQPQLVWSLSAALRWLDQGYTGVKIIGDGRLYTPEELAMKLQDKPDRHTRRSSAARNERPGIIFAALCISAYASTACAQTEPT